METSTDTPILTVLVLMTRGPHSPRYNWIGWSNVDNLCKPKSGRKEQGEVALGGGGVGAGRQGGEEKKRLP